MRYDIPTKTCVQATPYGLYCFLPYKRKYLYDHTCVGQPSGMAANYQGWLPIIRDGCQLSGMAANYQGWLPIIVYHTYHAVLVGFKPLQPTEVYTEQALRAVLSTYLDVVQLLSTYFNLPQPRVMLIQLLSTYFNLPQPRVMLSNYCQPTSTCLNPG